MNKANYNDIRHRIKPGDCIAFGGVGLVSNGVKIFTSSNVSHVGCVFDACGGSHERLIQIIESTSLGDGFAGVQFNRMSDHINYYDGNIWWLPLSDRAFQTLDLKEFYNFLIAQKGKPYDAPQAIGSALDFIPDNEENFDKLFCSELLAGAYEAGGLLADINASEQTPIDVCSMWFFDNPIQLKGDKCLTLRR